MSHKVTPSPFSLPTTSSSSILTWFVLQSACGELSSKWTGSRCCCHLIHAFQPDVYISRRLSNNAILSLSSCNGKHIVDNLGPSVVLYILQKGLTPLFSHCTWVVSLQYESGDGAAQTSVRLATMHAPCFKMRFTNKASQDLDSWLPPGKTWGVRDITPMHATAFCSFASPAVRLERRISATPRAAPQTTNAVQYVEMPPSLQRAYRRFSYAKGCLSGCFLIASAQCRADRLVLRFYRSCRNTWLA